MQCWEAAVRPRPTSLVVDVGLEAAMPSIGPQSTAPTETGLSQGLCPEGSRERTVRCQPNRGKEGEGSTAWYRWMVLSPQCPPVL